VLACGSEGSFNLRCIMESTPVMAGRVAVSGLAAFGAVRLSSSQADPLCIGAITGMVVLLAMIGAGKDIWLRIIDARSQAEKNQTFLAALKQILAALRRPPC
jgi:hypothetical protein